MDNKFYDNNGIVEESLQEFLKGNAWALPIYKYLKDYNKPILRKVKENINKNISIESFLINQTFYSIIFLYREEFFND